MRIKAEYKDRVVTYTSSMGVIVTKKLGELNRTDEAYLKNVGYNFDEVAEPTKKKAPKKYEGIKEDKEDNAGE